MTSTDGPSFREAVRFWVKLGFVNFGGPTGQIAIMHAELVQERRWVGEEAFLHALSFCMVLPGPEAQQLATYVGWLLHGIKGGLVAGTMFILPAAAAMGGLAWAYAAHGDVAWVGSVFDGLSAAVVGIVAAAAVSIAPRAVRTRSAMGIAAAAFIAIWVLAIPFPLVILAAGSTGIALGPSGMGGPGSPQDLHIPPSPTAGRTVRVAAIGLLAWWAPILLVVAVAGTSSVFSREGLFFSQVSAVTFGGAYAVLAYVGREVVARFGLSQADVVTGLGLAETTPGPLILVVEFLAFVAAYRAPGSLPPVLAGVLGAAVTLWATFAPSFLWVLVGAPYVERLRANQALRAALAGITAAVLGVIATLATSVAIAVLFTETTVARPLGADIVLPRPASVDVLHVAIASAAFFAIRRFRVHVAWVVLGSAAAGLAVSMR